MAGFRDTARRLREEKKRRSAADVLEAAIESRGGRRAATPVPAKKAPVRKAVKKTVPRRKRQPQPAQKIRSIAGGTSERQQRLAEINRRMKEIMSSSTTPDKR